MDFKYKLSVGWENEDFGKIAILRDKDCNFERDKNNNEMK